MALNMILVKAAMDGSAQRSWMSPAQECSAWIGFLRSWMMVLAIVPTMLRRSVRMSSVMKCELIPRSRSTTERRKLRCRSCGAFSRMRSKDAVSMRPRMVGSAAAACAERGWPSMSAISPKKLPGWMKPSVSCWPPRPILEMRMAPSMTR